MPVTSEFYLMLVRIAMFKCYRATLVPGHIGTYKVIPLHAAPQEFMSVEACLRYAHLKMMANPFLKTSLKGEVNA